MEVKRGDRVSLNTTKRLYYFQEGEGGINLSVDDKLMGVVPENATDMHLAQLSHDLRAGQIVLGWPEEKVDMLERDSDMKVLLECGRNKVEDWMKSIKDNTSILKSEKSSKIERLLSLEKAGKNRKSIIKTAENILSSIGGVSLVEETEQTKVEIKLTTGSDDIPETK